MFVYLKAVLVFIVAYFREYSRLFSMCRKSMKKTGGMETEDLILIWVILSLVFLVSPFVLLYTAFYRAKRWVAIYGNTNDILATGDVPEGDD